VSYFKQTFGAVCESESKILKTIAIEIGNHLILRHTQARLGKNSCWLKRPIAITKQDPGPASVSWNCHDQVLNGVAVKICNVNIGSINKKCVCRQSDCRLL